MPKPSSPKAQQRKVVQLPTMQRAATILPETFDEETNTVEVVWSTGARVRRYDWWEDEAYDEELEISEAAIDMSRFEAGAVPVLNNHRAYGGVDAILGMAERGWIAGQEARATLRLSQRQEVAGIVQDIRAGLIRNISVGYSVDSYERVPAERRDDGVQRTLYVARRWTPQELSFVTVPADAMAGTRSADQDAGRKWPCEIFRAEAAQHQRGNTMEDDIQQQGQQNEPATTVAPAGSAANDDVTNARAEGERAALQRAQEITQLCVRHGEPTLAADLIARNATVDQARAAILNARAERDEQSGGHRNVHSIRTVRDELETRYAGLQEAVLHRIDPRAALTDNGRQYRGLSLLEMGREWMQAAGIDTRGMDRMRLAGMLLSQRVAAYHTTGDFPALLADVANKRLRTAYDENAGTYMAWARRAPNAPDFKNINVVQLSGAPDLLRVNEHGEFTYGTMRDAGTTYNVISYGRIVSLTRQALINDDLRAFDRLITAFGYSSRRLENRLVYAQLTSNPVMSETGQALFDAAHNNVLGAPSVLGVSALSAGRALMRRQRGLQNEELNIVPSFLLVPASLEHAAYQFTSSNYVPDAPAQVNEFRQGGRTALTPVVEPLLDASSQTQWYLASNSGQVDTVEYCYLDGFEGAVIESEMGFEVDGMSMKCRLDFAAKVIDYRGLVRASGTAE